MAGLPVKAHKVSAHHGEWQQPAQQQPTTLYANSAVVVGGALDALALAFILATSVARCPLSVGRLWFPNTTAKCQVVVYLLLWPLCVALPIRAVVIAAVAVANLYTYLLFVVARDIRYLISLQAAVCVQIFVARCMEQQQHRTGQVAPHFIHNDLLLFFMRFSLWWVHCLCHHSAAENISSRTQLTHSKSTHKYFAGCCAHNSILACSHLTVIMRTRVCVCIFCTCSLQFSACHLHNSALCTS